MPSDLVINVTYNGDDAFKDNFFQIPYNITWEDLEAMLKAHFDCSRLSVTYLDEENDEISIGGQDELFEAFRFAMVRFNTLYLKVMPVDKGASIFRMFDCDLDGGGRDGEAKQRDANANTVDPEGPVPSPGAFIPIPLPDVIRDPIPSPGSDIAIPMPDVERDPIPSPGSDIAIPMPDVERDFKERRTDVKSPDSDIYEDLDKADNQEDVQDQLPDDVDEDVMECLRQESVDTVSEQLSYPEFVAFMTKLKKELRTEIVRDVTKKTVKQVLKGLDGAVIESLQSSQTSKHSLSNSGTRAKPKDTHPIYSHDGVFCDMCNTVINGPRYKCGNCLDFDLCETCEANPNTHNPIHVFVKIRTPCMRVGISSDGERRPLLKSVIYKTQKKHSTKMVVPIPRENAVENEINFKLEGKMKDIFARNEEKRRNERKMAKLKKKEEKLKRRMDQMSESPIKRERLELMDDDSTVRYDFYKVLMGAQFLHDISVPDQTKLQSGTKFTKTWRMKNDGDGPWSESTKLKLMWGNIPTPDIEVTVPHLKPSEEGNISVDFVSPAEPGDYQSHWKLYEHGMQFGSRIWCTILVVPRETLEPTVEEKDSLKVVMDMSQKSDTGELQDGKEPEIKNGENIEITFRSNEEEHLREISVRREPDVESYVSDKQDSVFVNIEDTDKTQDSLFEGEPDIVPEDHTKQEVVEYDGKVEGVKDDGKQEVEIVGQFEHVEVDEDVKEDGSMTCEGFVVYAKHEDTDDLVEVQKKEDKNETDKNPKLEADLTFAVARLTLEGENRELAPLVSQTATPNNTPFDVTPLKTPNPEPEDEEDDDDDDDVAKDHEDRIEKDLKGISNSSSVELVQAPENEEFQGEQMESYIKARLASLELKPDIDLESVSSYSEDDDEDSGLSDSDYIIVPLPDCFNISKPMIQSTTLSSYSNSVVDRDFSLDDNHNSVSPRSSRAVSVDEILTTSGVLDQRPLSPSPPDSQGQPDTVILRETRVNTEIAESNESFQAPENEVPVKNEPIVQAVNPVTEQPSGVSSLPLPVGREDGVSSPSIDDPLEGDDNGASGAASGENIDGDSQSRETILEDTIVKEPLSASAEMPDNVTYVKVGDLKQKNNKSVDFAPEFANQLVATAVTAAGQAYITAKAVFKTWQDKQAENKESSMKNKSKTPMKGWKPASTQYVPQKEDEYTAPKSNWVPEKDEYTPQKSEWKPKESDFKLPESNYKPPEANYKPPQSTWKPPADQMETRPKAQWVPPTRESGPMGKLFDMGFMDRELNKELLNKHKDDVQLVIQDLLSLQLS